VRNFHGLPIPQCARSNRKAFAVKTHNCLVPGQNLTTEFLFFTFPKTMCPIGISVGHVSSTLPVNAMIHMLSKYREAS
jgi:hypothetical protein